MSDNSSVVEDTGVATATRKKKKPVDSTRFRISVPNADASVIEWIEHQNNLSYSIRHLIHEAIQRKGMVDATCEFKLHKVNRGRPNKQSEPVDEYSYVSSDDVDTETEVAEPVQAVVPDVAQNVNPNPIPVQPQVTQQMPVVQPVVQPMPAQVTPMQHAAASAPSSAASSLLSSL